MDTSWADNIEITNQLYNYVKNGGENLNHGVFDFLVRVGRKRDAKSLYYKNILVSVRVLFKKCPDAKLETIVYYMVEIDSMFYIFIICVWQNVKFCFCISYGDA